MAGRAQTQTASGNSDNWINSGRQWRVVRNTCRQGGQVQGPVGRVMGKVSITTLNRTIGKNQCLRTSPHGNLIEQRCVVPMHPIHQVRWLLVNTTTNRYSIVGTSERYKTPFQGTLLSSYHAHLLRCSRTNSGLSFLRPPDESTCRSRTSARKSP